MRFSPFALVIGAFAIVAACNDSSGTGTPGAFDAGTSGGFDSGAVETDAAVAVDASSPSDAADAAVVTATTPFNTGLDPSSVALADKAIDPHWTVKDSAGTALTAYVQTEALGYEGYWMRPSATSKFISPFMDTVDPSGNGVFTYTTTFTLGDDVALGATTLEVAYACDNDMTGITANGTALGDFAIGGYATFSNVSITSLVHGVNTVSFTVTNSSGGPTGFRAELTLNILKP